MDTRPHELQISLLDLWLSIAMELSVHSMFRFHSCLPWISNILKDDIVATLAVSRGLMGPMTCHPAFSVNIPQAVFILFLEACTAGEHRADHAVAVIMRVRGRSRVRETRHAHSESCVLGEVALELVAWEHQYPSTDVIL